MHTHIHIDHRASRFIHSPCLLSLLWCWPWYWTQVLVPKAQWGQTNLNIRVWRIERLVARPSKNSSSYFKKQNKTEKKTWTLWRVSAKHFSKQDKGEKFQGPWSACAQFWLVDGDQSLGSKRSGGYVLMINKLLISSIWWWFLHLKNSRNMHQLLLSRYFWELEGRMWGRGLSQEGLRGPCQITTWWELSIFLCLW